MGIFYNPIDGPPSLSQLLGTVLYAFLALISVWATGESLSLTYAIPIWIAYLVGAGIVLIMAAMMSIIKKGMEERNLSPLITGISVFLTVWFISLGTNTHNFYLKGSLENIQEEEMKEIKKELEGIQINSESIINDIVGTCRTNIANKITNYQTECNNPVLLGHGPAADSLKRVVQASMPGSAFTVPKGDWDTSRRKKRSLCDMMGDIMNSELNTRIISMNEKKGDIENLVVTEKYNTITNDLNNKLSAFHNSSIKENRQSISNSYQLYNGLKQGINSILLSGFLECTDEAGILSSEIPNTPGSIELEHISNTYKYVKSKGGFSTSEVLWSFLLALGVDLGAFAVFYFMVLKND